MKTTATFENGLQVTYGGKKTGLTHAWALYRNGEFLQKGFTTSLERCVLNAESNINDGWSYLKISSRNTPSQAAWRKQTAEKEGFTSIKLWNTHCDQKAQAVRAEHIILTTTVD